MKNAIPLDIRFFPSAEAFTGWLAEHHADTHELWLGYYKKGSGKTGITYPESLDAALCFGWIDGVRVKVDDDSYTNRFSHRKPGSQWSPTNIKRVEELIRLGRMQPSGLSAYENRREKIFGEFTYENRSPDLPEPYAGILQENEAAWQFYNAQTPSYRKVANWYVVSVKKEETRLKRLSILIESCAAGRFIPAMEKYNKSK